MIQPLLQQSEQKMQKSIASLKTELAKLRTGRAHPGLLEHITVSYYGSDVPLSQVANVTVADARTLAISVWDKTMIQAVEKAILKSDLSLNPVVTGELMRIPMPALNEERRKDLVKIVKNEGEAARVAVRNIRRDANNQLKEWLKQKTISEDEERRGEENIQKLTDKLIAEVDLIVTHKESELMEI